MTSPRPLAHHGGGNIAMKDENFPPGRGRRQTGSEFLPSNFQFSLYVLSYCTRQSSTMLLGMISATNRKQTNENPACEYKRQLPPALLHWSVSGTVRKSCKSILVGHGFDSTCCVRSSDAVPASARPLDLIDSSP